MRVGAAASNCWLVQAVCDEQDVEPVLDANLPESQKRHADALVAPVPPKYVPAGQAVQVVLAIAPRKGEYLPAPQSVQDFAA